MAYRIPYFSQSLFVGPSPSTGYHFMTYDSGLLNNRYFDLGGNHNLLQLINRVQNVNIFIEADREEIRQVGTRSLVSRPNVNFPKINLSFEYLLNGLANDARIGLNVNFAQHYLNVSGTPYHSNNYNVNLLSGLIARQFGQPTGDPFWPMPLRDNRNIFLVRAQEGHEVLRLSEYFFNQRDLYRGVDPEAPTYEVMGLGQCYLNSYETRGAVNQIPVSKVSYSCENINFYVSGSGCNIPAINTTTREPINQNKFNIPETRDEGGAHILNPGDILLSITPTGFSHITGLGINFDNITIQNYQINFDLNRDLLQSLGHQCPLDREVTFPVIVNLGFGAVMGNLNSGNFIDILNFDSGYNIDIKLRNPLYNAPFHLPFTRQASGEPTHAGPVSSNGQIAIMYSFRNARFENITYETSIGDNKMANVNFSVELDPDSLNRQGFFISGLLNIDKTEDYLIDESGWCIIDENYQVLVTNLKPLF